MGYAPGGSGGGEAVETALIAVDWGTSNFRAYDVDATGAIRDRRAAPQGILQVPDGAFADAFADLVGDWLEAAPDAPVVMSGMIGSRSGWSEAAYAACPADAAALAQSLHPVPFGARTLSIVPGLSTVGPSGVHDVIRGEETQIFGALGDTAGRTAVCLPGTHAKWADVADGRVTGFRTAMTGEVFAVMAEHSILGRTMAGPEAPADAAAFARGLARADEAGGLLHHAFGVRAEALFDALKPAAARSYLSGLLIGHELGGMADILAAVPEVTVIGADALSALYVEALAGRGVATRRVAGDTAVVDGLVRVARLARLLKDAP